MEADSLYRKVEGEAKGAGHDDGKGTVVVGGTSVPLRRWDDWERSRLRKIKREEKRRQDLLRAFPAELGGLDQGEFLAPRPLTLDRYSTVDSDTYSLASSADDDVWGAQVGGYDENNVKYPPPPLGLFVNPDTVSSAVTLGDGDMEALLEQGWDEVTPSPPPMSPAHNGRQRTYQGYPLPTPTSTDSMPSTATSQAPLMQSYSPVSTPRGERIGSPPSPYPPGNAATSGVHAWQSHAKKRSGGRGNGPGNPPGDYGPLGPLDPENR
jgi:chitin synthase